MKKQFLIALVIVLGLAAVRTLWAAEFDLPAGKPITEGSIRALIGRVYEFMVWFASVAVVATIVISGIMWLSAGDNPDRVKKAKAIFKGGLIGAIIILGAGVIVNTIGYFVQNAGDPGTFNESQNPRQSSGSGSSGGTGSGTGGSTSGSCRDDSNCPSGFICITQSGSSFCGLPTGRNKIGQVCLFDVNCLNGLVCDGAGSGGNRYGTCQPK